MHTQGIHMHPQGIKQIRLILEEDVYENLVKLKGELTWNEFLKEVAYSLTDGYVLAKADETYTMIKEKMKHDNNKYELIELNRVQLINIYKGNYDAALRAYEDGLKKLKQLVKTQEQKAEEKEVESILNAKPEESKGNE